MYATPARLRRVRSRPLLRRCRPRRSRSTAPTLTRACADDQRHVAPRSSRGRDVRSARSIYHVFRADVGLRRRIRTVLDHADRRDRPETLTTSPTHVAGRRRLLLLRAGRRRRAPTGGLGPLSRSRYDTTPPVITPVTQTGGNGCVAIHRHSATATDNLAAGHDVTDAFPNPYVAGHGAHAGGPQFASVSVDVRRRRTPPGTRRRSTASRVTSSDPTRPPAPVLEVDTDPAQQKATLSWDSVDERRRAGAHVSRAHQGPAPDRRTWRVGNVSARSSSANLQVDATYEYSLYRDRRLRRQRGRRSASSGSTTRRRRARRSSPARRSTAASHAGQLSWVAAQRQHPGRPLPDPAQRRARSASPMRRSSPTRRRASTPQLSYVVRAVDTNGNETDSDARDGHHARLDAADAPVPTVTAQGTTVTLTLDRGDRQRRRRRLRRPARWQARSRSMTAAVRTYVGLGT